jgi:hypothetical protein
MSQHFNRLTPAEAERLALLIEECAEVQQSATKILRHGYESVNPKLPKHLQETNRHALERELGDLMHCIKRMGADLDIERINTLAESVKPETIKPYLHHQ